MSNDFARKMIRDNICARASFCLRSIPATMTLRQLHFASLLCLCLGMAVPAIAQTPEKPKVVVPAALPASTAMTPGAPPPVVGGFTIMVVPDTQYYSQKYPDIFHKQIQWIGDNLQRYNVPFVLQLGDITETAADAEWEVAKAAFARLDGKVPYVLTPGNHDYGDRLQVLSKRSAMSRYFPVSLFEKMSTFGGVYDAQPDKSDNSYHKFEAGGRKWLVIALEFAPRNDVVRWAGDICAKHPDHSVIIITHAYLEAKTNQRIAFTGGYGYKPAPAAPGAPPPEKPDLNLGVDLWNKLASQHENVAMVLCGHTSYTNKKSDKGKAGNVVHEVVVDYQRDVNGGNGWMRLLQVLPDGRTVRTRDYSPILDQTCTMPDRTYDMDFAPLKVKP
jgi:hypothetical protein